MDRRREAQSRPSRQGVPNSPPRRVRNARRRRRRAPHPRPRHVARPRCATPADAATERAGRDVADHRRQAPRALARPRPRIFLPFSSFPLRGIFFRSEIRRVTLSRKRARRDRPPAGGSLPEVPDRALDAWMTSSAGPFLTMNAGGALEGVVTIAVATEGSDQLL